MGKNSPSGPRITVYYHQYTYHDWKLQNNIQLMIQKHLDKNELLSIY